MILQPRASRAPGLLLVLLVLLAYGRVLGGAFQFDDFNVIAGDPGVHSLGAWVAGLGGIRPLLKGTYTVNWLLGESPEGFLAVNLALHLGNTWMVHRLLGAVARRGGLEPSRAEATAWLGALIFGLHPVQTEAVAYISGRSSSLSAALSLASVLAYLKGRDTGRKGWSSWISPGFFLLAVLAKETALVLPLALTLWEGCGRGPDAKPVRGPRAHWLLVFAGFALLAVHPGYRRFLAASLDLRGAGDQLRGSLEGLGYLFGKLLWPVGLNIDPPLAVPGRWGWPTGLVAVGVVAIPALGIWALRRQPWLGFGLLWGLVFLLPTQGPIPRLDLANERHLYLALAGFAFAGGGLLTLLPRPTQVGVGCLLALTLGVRTAARVEDYREEVSLWKASLRVAPENPRAWNNLGVAFHARGNPREAAGAFARALRLRPDYPLAQDNLRLMEAAP